MIYLFCFFVSAFFFMWSEKLLQHKKRKSYTVVCIIAIAIPALLAGLRDFSIGTDVLLYGNSWFNNAHYSSSLLRYIAWTTSSDIGAGYALINYITAMFTIDVRVFYFVLNFLTILFVYIGVSGFRNRISVPFAMLTYYLMFYNSSLNILRQSIAMGALLVAYRFIADKKYYWFFVMIAISFMLHSSAILMVVLFPIALISSGYYRKIYTIIMFAVSAALLMIYPYVLQLMVKIGVLSERYIIYAGSTYIGGRMIRLAFYGILFVMTLLLQKNLVRYDKRCKLFINCAVLSFVFSLLLFLGNNQVIRAAYYFDISLVITIPMLANQFKVSINDKKSVKILYPALTILLTAHWFITIVIQNNGQTYPYVLGV